MSNNNHKANQKNSNKGTPGMNDAYKGVVDNRANQLNPNNVRHQPVKSASKPLQKSRVCNSY